jgi:uncharacterized membrane protein (UPF0127 family)
MSAMQHFLEHFQANWASLRVWRLQLDKEHETFFKLRKKARILGSKNAIPAKGALRSTAAHRHCVFSFFVGLVSVFLILALTLPPASQAQAGFEKLVLETASGPHEFAVEVMRTHAELEKGLMFRKYLPENRGMLFDFKAEQPVMMWMKNTFLPLDMIFISRNGQVTAITENAEPLSERIISSNGPVFGVLEVNAGTIAKIALKIGDHVEHPLFK